MIRREEFCGGRLVKEIDQVDVSRWSTRDQYIDGPWTWYLDSEEIQPVEADAFQIMWEAGKP